jgi:hypothetical protein
MPSRHSSSSSTATLPAGRHSLDGLHLPTKVMLELGAEDVIGGTIPQAFDHLARRGRTKP